MLNIEDFRAAAEQGSIRRTAKNEYELFNYTSETANSRLWNEITLEARGVVFHRGKIVCRPMRKFFNSHEPGADFVDGLYTPEVLLKKLDGTLINLWCDLDGVLNVSTRGSLDNEYIDGAWELIKQNRIDSALAAHFPVSFGGGTFSFEYTYPQLRFGNSSVVPHENERLSLLNIRMRNGCEYNAAKIDRFGAELYGEDAFTLSQKRYSIATNVSNPSIPEAVEQALLLPYTDEGWVVSAYDHKLLRNIRVKIKGAQYIAMHRVVHGMTPRSVADAWYAGVTDELLDMLLEPHKNQLAEAFKPYDELLATATSVTQDWVENYLADSEEFTGGTGFERREFVLDAQRDIPNHWQFAIQEYYSDSDPDYKKWVVRKLNNGKAPRAWELPVTDDVKE